MVDPKGGQSDISYQTFPNPATNSLQMQFNNNQTGRFLLELIATSGQVVQRKEVTLTGTSQIRLDLNPQPVRGLYFLRTTDITHSRNFVRRYLLISIRDRGGPWSGILSLSYGLFPVDLFF